MPGLMANHAVLQRDVVSCLSKANRSTVHGIVPARKHLHWKHPIWCHVVNFLTGTVLKALPFNNYTQSSLHPISHQWLPYTITPTTYQLVSWAKDWHTNPREVPMSGFEAQHTFKMCSADYAGWKLILRGRKNIMPGYFKFEYAHLFPGCLLQIWINMACTLVSGMFIIMLTRSNYKHVGKLCLCT